jgi:hypothetical protein
MDFEKDFAGTAKSFSTDFVLANVEWSPQELREALRAHPRSMVILERKEQFAPKPFHYLYPYSLLVALLDALTLSGDDLARVLDILKPMLARVGKPLQWNPGDFDPSEVGTRYLLSLHETTSDPEVSPNAASERIPSVVVGPHGPEGFTAPISWDNEEFQATVRSVFGQHAKPPEHVSQGPPLSEHTEFSLGSPIGGARLPDDASFDVRSDEPPATEARGLDGGGASPPNRFLNAKTNDRVELNDQFSLFVRVSTTAASDAGAGSIPLDTKEKPIVGKVNIDVYAPGLKILDGASKTLDVPAAGDSAPIRFGLQAVKSGIQTIQISAWFGSAYIGAIDLKVAVAQASVSDGTSVADMDMREPEEGEYTLEIEYDDDKRSYCFRLRGDKTTFEPVPGDKLQGQAQDVYNGIISDLNAQARNLYRRDPALILAWLQGMGGDMFRTLVPRDIKEALWDNAGKIKRLNILSRNDNLPWEVLYVLPKNVGEGRFLVDAATICRWTYGRKAPTQVSKKTPCYILPAGAPTSAQDEYGRIQTRLGTGTTIADTAALTALLRSGGFGLLHFMAHNIETSTPEQKPYIPFGGGQRFDLTYMGSIPDKKYVQDSPLIFLNACTSAGSKPLYTEMGGWASRFLQCGAGAYIGALWEIRDKSAGSFADAFYGELVSGKNLGEAMAAGRRAIPQGDPTYLAYTLYGNPLAKLV